MSDDLVRYRQEEVHLGGGDVEIRYVESKDGWIASYADAKAALDAKDAEIARLRDAINNALLEPWSDGQLSGTWHQEPIGPNETPEEAIKRLVRVRAEWAVYRNNCENPEIAELRAALATARREGMKEAADAILVMIDEEEKRAAIPFSAKEDNRPSEEIIREDRDAWPDHQANDLIATARREGMEAMAEKIAGWHEAQAMEHEAQASKFEKLKKISNFNTDGQYAARYAEGAAAHRQRAAAIRAAAKEGKP